MTDNQASAPSLSQNFVSLFGAALGFASVAGIVFVLLIEIFGSRENPYIGIFAWIIFPAFLILGLIAFYGGRILERRRRKKHGGIAYPILDLNDRRRRRQLLAFVGVLFAFLFISSFGCYRAYEYTESVVFCGQVCHVPMKPQFTALQQSAHARVLCVDCHVGAGAGWYVKSKIQGAHQVYALALNNYPRPIPTPVENMRPAEETCGHCHWSEKSFGPQLKVFRHYAQDEENTVRESRLLVNLGGGDPDKGHVTGIHWHANLANEITYISTDGQRQVIPWVQLKDRNGTITEYTVAESPLGADQIATRARRRMDCTDCHNRPGHLYDTPDRSTNDALGAGRLDATLPFLKQKAVEALSAQYSSTDEGVRSIASSLDEYYRTTYPDVYSGKADSLKASIAEVQRIFKTNFFPEMKADWQTHPDNSGHYYYQGCFRCHDGKHVSSAGKMIRNDCALCHTTLDQTEGGTAVEVKAGAFSHPLGLEVNGTNCTECHSGKGMRE